LIAVAADYITALADLQISAADIDRATDSPALLRHLMLRTLPSLTRLECPGSLFQAVGPLVGCRFLTSLRCGAVRVRGADIRALERFVENCFDLRDLKVVWSSTAFASLRLVATRLTRLTLVRIPCGDLEISTPALAHVVIQTCLSNQALSIIFAAPLLESARLSTMWHVAGNFTTEAEVRAFCDGAAPPRLRDLRMHDFHSAAVLAAALHCSALTRLDMSTSSLIPVQFRTAAPSRLPMIAIFDVKQLTSTSSQPLPDLALYASYLAPAASPHPRTCHPSQFASVE
jgi:hypothetical protein